MKDIIAVAALFAFTSSAGAQEKKAALIPSTYEGCMQPAVLESLVMQGPDTWGLGSDHSEAFREVQGYFLCHAVAGRGEDSCTTLQNMPDFKWSKLMGVNCKMDFRALMTHESLAAKQTSEAVRHCSRWCRLSKGERDKKMVCPNVCRKAIEEFRRDRDSACSVTMKETARGLGVGRDWVEETTLFCRQKFTPELKDCRDETNDDKADCEATVALFAAYARGDERRCPKDGRYEGVCKVLIRRKGSFAVDRTGSGGGDDPSAACDENGKRFLKRLCDYRKASGGLRQKTTKAETGEY
ncbi:MAG: hypothetical protein COX66_02105 [Elusimicrobia bacterium CG_4_10_14_0_2_um_filter_63_34]|nr:MAG: hypothetical protein COX66_02105 [Elusimicrobia bacterium CG_4_10_14_0_2_um_filter_63_34]